MKKILPYAFLMIVLAPVALLAGGGFNYPEHVSGNPAVKQYVNGHIMPVLQKKRDLLEGELTAIEKTEIAECRTALKQLHEQQEASAQHNTSNAGYAQKEGSRQQFDAKHEQVRDIMQRLETIANKHSNTLDNMCTELEPTRKQWKEDIAKLQPQKEDNIPYSPNQNHQRMHDGLPFLSFNHHYAMAHFLLMPATSPVGELKSDMLTPSTGTNANMLGSFQILPNPASNEIVTGNDLLPAENQMLIMDIQGKTVKSIQNVQPAQHIDISQVPNGTYIVQFNGGGQVSNTKVVIAH